MAAWLHNNDIINVSKKYDNQTRTSTCWVNFMEISWLFFSIQDRTGPDGTVLNGTGWNWMGPDWFVDSLIHWFTISFLPCYNYMKTSMSRITSICVVDFCIFCVIFCLRGDMFEYSCELSVHPMYWRCSVDGWRPVARRTAVSDCGIWSRGVVFTNWPRTRQRSRPSVSLIDMLSALPLTTDSVCGPAAPANWCTASSWWALALSLFL